MSFRAVNRLKRSSQSSSWLCCLSLFNFIHVPFGVNVTRLRHDFFKQRNIFPRTPFSKFILYNCFSSWTYKKFQFFRSPFTKLCCSWVSMLHCRTKKKNNCATQTTTQRSHTKYLTTLWPCVSLDFRFIEMKTNNLNLLCSMFVFVFQIWHSAFASSASQKCDTQTIG